MRTFTENVNVTDSDFPAFTLWTNKSSNHNCRWEPTSHLPGNNSNNGCQARTGEEQSRRVLRSFNLNNLHPSICTFFFVCCLFVSLPVCQGLNKAAISAKVSSRCRKYQSGQRGSEVRAGDVGGAHLSVHSERGTELRCTVDHNTGRVIFLCVWLCLWVCKFLLYEWGVKLVPVFMT